MKTYSYVNGKITPISEASIGLTDLALQRGYGVFDYMRTYNSRLFHFDDHCERLKNSASALNLKLPIAAKEIKEIGMHLISESELNKPALRYILTGGYSDSSPQDAMPNFIIIAEELPAYPPELYSHGAKLIAEFYQRELPHAKSINYLNAFRLEHLKKEEGALDILYHSEHGITECPRNNFFVFHGNKLITPKDFILHGITRKIILQLTNEYFPIEERRIDFNELSDVDEAFVTSTTKGIIPIVRIDQNIIGAGNVGDNTKKLMQLFGEYTKNYNL